MGHWAKYLLLPQTQFTNRGLVSYMYSSGRILEVSNTGVHPVSQVRRRSGVVRRVLMGCLMLVNRLLAVSVSGHA